MLSSAPVDFRPVPRRILLLSSSTGSGHDRRAQAFREWIELLYPDQFEVRQEQIIEESSLLGAFGVWLYNQIQRHAPIAHNLYWEIVEVFTATNCHRVSIGGRHYRQILREFLPHMVISLHDCTNRGYFQDARRIVGPSVKTITYCGEWSGGHGFSTNWVEPTADCFVGRTTQAVERAIRQGCDPAKTEVLTNFLPPAAMEAPFTPARQRHFREELGLDPDRFTVFISTGSQGAAHHLRFLNALCPLADRVQAVLVCGRNEEALAQARTWRQQHPELRLHLEGFSRRVPQLMRAADCVVTRGGANTAAEALQAGCPLVFHTLGGIMPQERLTVRYFQESQAAALVHNERELEQLVRTWLDQPEAHRTIRDNLLGLRSDDHPAMWIHRLAAELGIAEGRTAVAVS